MLKWFNKLFSKTTPVKVVDRVPSARVERKKSLIKVTFPRFSNFDKIYLNLNSTIVKFKSPRVVGGMLVFYDSHAMYQVSYPPGTDITLVQVIDEIKTMQKRDDSMYLYSDGVLFVSYDDVT